MDVEKNRVKDAAVEIRHLRKAYGGLPLYDGFSFDIERGAVTVLTGPSGCGKTTLLRMIAGLAEPDGGSIVFKGFAEPGGGSGRPEGAKEIRPTGPADGSETMNPAKREKTVKRGKPVERDPAAAILFQEDRLLPWLTVRENMRLVLPREAEGQQAEERLEELLSLLELSGFGDYYPEKLSGGMRRRAAIGRVLLYADSAEYVRDREYEGHGQSAGPERQDCPCSPAGGAGRGGTLLLMDEPFKGLDDALKMRVMAALSAEWKKKGSTVVLVTHDRKDAGFLGDRLWEFSGQPVEARLVYSR